MTVEYIDVTDWMDKPTGIRVCVQQVGDRWYAWIEGKMTNRFVRDSKEAAVGAAVLNA